jgi:hypothetical protein
MRLYQVIIEKPDKGIFITRLNLQVIKKLLYFSHQQPHLSIERK